MAAQKSKDRSDRWREWRKRWPLWRLSLAAIFVAIHFWGIALYGMFPSELRSQLPPDTLPLRVAMTAALLPIILPVALGPDWRQRSLLAPVFYAGLLTWVTFVGSWNVVARSYADSEFSRMHSIAAKPTEFRLYDLKPIRSRYGRSYSMQLQSADGIQSWHPAGGTDVEAHLIGQCVTLLVKRNEHGVTLIDKLGDINRDRFHDCP